MAAGSAILQQTPLYEAALVAGGRMVAFGGWEMPVQFAGIAAEHQAVREKVGLFDVSHMGQLVLTGDRVAEFIDFLLPGRIAELDVGQMLYAPMCNQAGGCIDDAVVYRLDGSEFLLVVNAGRVEDDWQWITKLAAGESNVNHENLSDEKAMLAVQGPMSEKIVTAVVGDGIGALSYYHCLQTQVGVMQVLISRNGYTGEDGFEFLCSVDDVVGLWDQFIAAGAQPCGLGARDTLRTEMGFCLYGHELNEVISPLQAGLAWTLQMDKDFVGAQALRDQRTAGKFRRLRGIRMVDRGIPRPGYAVLDTKGLVIGEVTSGTHSPTLGLGIGLVYLDRGADTVGGPIFIDIRGKKRLAEVAKLPFVPFGIKRDN